MDQWESLRYSPAVLELRKKAYGEVMTKQEAIDKTLLFMEPYLKQESLNDLQAARIGRTLYANLRQAERDAAGASGSAP